MKQFMEVLHDEKVEVQTPEHSKLYVKQVERKLATHQLASLLQNLPSDDRMEWMAYQKSKGNKLYQQEKYKKAIEIYEKMSVGLRDDTMEYKIIIVANLALCHKKLGLMEQASKFYDMVQPSPLRYLRRAYFHFESGDIQKTIQGLNSIQKPIPLELVADYNKLVIMMQQQKDDEKKIYKKMFKGPSMLTKLKIWFQQVCGCRRLFDEEDVSVEQFMKS
ncbi:hypothetical protein pb186bvf_002069 [Paramecium bursaria]